MCCAVASLTPKTLRVHHRFVGLLRELNAKRLAASRPELLTTALADADLKGHQAHAHPLLEFRCPHTCLLLLFLRLFRTTERFYRADSSLICGRFESPTGSYLIFAFVVRISRCKLRPIYRCSP